VKIQKTFETTIPLEKDHLEKQEWFPIVFLVGGVVCKKLWENSFHLSDISQTR